MAGAHGKWKRLGDGSLLTEDADEGLGHVLTQSTYIKTLGTLLILTFLTVWVAQFDFGSWNAVVALFIATIKAGIVASFFMHLKYEAKLILLFAIYPLLLLFVMIGGTFGDYASRNEVVPMVPTGTVASQP